MPVTSKYYPEDLTEMRAAIFDWARAEVPAAIPIVWKTQNAPAPPRPYVGLSLFVPPATIGSAAQSNTGHAVLVRTALPLTDYTITIDGDDYVYTSEDPTSATAIRDGLVDVLETADFDVVALSTVTQDSLAIDGDELVVSVDANLRIKIPQQTVGDANATLSVDAYTVMTPGALTGALEIVAPLEHSLETDGAQEILTAGGWSFRSVEGRRDGDTTMNGKNEDRAGFDVRLGCKTRQVRPIDWIETVVSGGVSGMLGDIETP